MSNTQAVTMNPIIKELVEAGIIPPNCYSFRLTCNAGDVVRIQCRVFAEEKQLRGAADALLKNPNAIKRTIRKGKLKP